MDTKGCRFDARIADNLEHFFGESEAPRRRAYTEAYLPK
jgi:hypothetical protein